MSPYELKQELQQRRKVALSKGKDHIPLVNITVTFTEFDQLLAALDEAQQAQQLIASLQAQIAERQKAAELERHGYHQDRLTWNANEERRTAAKLKPLESEIERLEAALQKAEALLKRWLTVPFQDETHRHIATLDYFASRDQEK